MCKSCAADVVKLVYYYYETSYCSNCGIPHTSLYISHHSSLCFSFPVPQFVHSQSLFPGSHRTLYIGSHDLAHSTSFFKSSAANLFPVAPAPRRLRQQCKHRYSYKCDEIMEKLFMTSNIFLSYLSQPRKAMRRKKRIHPFDRRPLIITSPYCMLLTKRNGKYFGMFDAKRFVDHCINSFQAARIPTLRMFVAKIEFWSVKQKTTKRVGYCVR